MNLKATSLLLAGGLAVAATQADAGMLWHGESLTYLNGQHYKVDPPNQQTVTFEHVSSWTWGDIFLFVDNIWFNGKGSDSAGEHTYYGEFSPRLSFGKITGKDLSFGPISDVLLSATYERGENGNQNYLLGPAVDLTIPGFDYFQLNTYYRKPDGITGNPAGQWQVTPAWGMTIPVGKSDILFDGFIDWVVNDKSNSNNDMHKNLHINPQIKYDLGKALGYQAKHLYVGIEYDYWSDKYAIEDGGFVSDNFVGSTDQNTFSWIVKAHF